MESLNTSTTASTQFISLNQIKMEKDFLVQWVLEMSSDYDMQNKVNYTISGIYNSKYIPYILHQISSQVFSLSFTQTQMESAFIDYFYKEFGFCISPMLGIQSEKEQMFISLLLYACIYSQQKQRCVHKILRLDLQIQQKIVNQIQIVQMQLRQLRSWDKMVQHIKNLQQKNSELKNVIKNLSQKQQFYISQINCLQKQLQQTKQERNQFVIQKRKILCNFKLSSFAEYEDLCKKLYKQNQLKQKKQQKLLSTIQSLQKEIESLNQGMKNSDSVIVQLNSQYSDLQKQYLDLTRQVSFYKDSFLQNQSRVQSKILGNQSTFDSTFLHSSIKSNRQHRRVNSQFSSDFFRSTNLSINSRHDSFSRNPRNSAYNMFKATKDNILLNEKLQISEQEIEQLKVRVSYLESQIQKVEKRQKYQLKKNRKIMKASDQFKRDYQMASCFAVTL